MYNPELKFQYVEDYVKVSHTSNQEKIRAAFINLFNRLEEYEDNLKKDFLQMTKEEMLDVLSKFLRGGLAYRKSTLSSLCQYVSWGIEKGIAPSNENYLVGVSLSSVDVSESYAESMVKDEIDLKHCLDSILSALKEDSVDNLYRCFLVLLYSGIDSNEILLLKETDFDFANSCISQNGREISLSEYACSVVNYTRKMDVLRKRNRSNEEDRARHKIFPSGYLIKNTVENSTLEYRRAMKRTFDSAISGKFRYCERNLTQSRIAKSGIFYRMYMNEKATGKIDCTEYLYYNRGRVKTIESPGRVAEEARQEYLIWKKAFRL